MRRFFLLIAAATGSSLVFNKSVAEIANFLTASPPRPVPPLSDTSGAQQIRLSLDDLLHKADSLLPALSANARGAPGGAKKNAGRISSQWKKLHLSGSIYR
ncbi:MAG TPA: hypothetical protein VFS89_09505 [Nitrosospira sp.]|nr:hypothetical protein [Nitrosospira sp.]